MFLEEYKLLDSHYQHEDRVLEDRQKFVSTLMAAMLIATIGILTSDYFPVKSATVFFSIFGMLLSFVWWSMAKASYYYMKLRLLQLNELEEKLGFNIHKTEWKLCFDKVPVLIWGEKLFPPKKRWFMGYTVPVGMSSLFFSIWVIVLIYALFNS